VVLALPLFVFPCRLSGTKRQMAAAKRESKAVGTRRKAANGRRQAAPARLLTTNLHLTCTPAGASNDKPGNQPNLRAPFCAADGLQNRYVKPYTGFESTSLRHVVCNAEKYCCMLTHVGAVDRPGELLMKKSRKWFLISNTWRTANGSWRT
jgi:hypothetical protein